MSSKQPNVLERHCEKVLAVSFAVILVGVIVWQLIFFEMRVKVGSDSVPLQQLNEKLAQKETDLSRKLGASGDSPLELPQAKQVSSIELFETGRSKPISPGSELKPTEPSFGKLLTGGTVANSQWFYEPTFAAPQMRGAVVSTDAIDLNAVDAEVKTQSSAFFAQFVPPAPTDVTWVTPFAIIDPTALRAELERADRSQRPAREAIPRPWFSDSLFIVDVVFERQRLGSDGAWCDKTVVVPPPGQDSWRPAAESAGANASTRDTVFANLADDVMQLDVLQPPLIAMKGQNFREPQVGGTVAEVGVSDAERAQESAAKKIQKLRSEFERLVTQLKEAGGRLDPPKKDGEPPPGEGGSGGGVDGGNKGGGGFGMGGDGAVKKGDNAAASADAQAKKDLRMKLTRRVDQKGRELRKLEDSYAAKFPKPAVEGTKAAAPPKPPLRASTELLAWTHDFSAIPGETYQYRATLKIYNPFFTHKILLVEAQQSLTQSLTVASTTSGWGEAIAVPLPSSFFVTRGSAKGGMGGRRLSVELFKYSNGVLRTATDELVVGDAVGEDSPQKGERIDFSTPWYLADLFDDAGNDASGGVVAVFRRFDAAGALMEEIRTVAGDSNSPALQAKRRELPSSIPILETPKDPNS